MKAPATIRHASAPAATIATAAPVAPATPEAAAAHGARAWQHPKTGEWRWYVGEEAIAKAIGLVTQHYNSGSISSATLAGEEISNTKAAKMLFAISRAKVWYDEAGTLHIDGASSELTALMEESL